MLGYQLKMTVGEIINRSIRLKPTSSIPAVQVMRLEITLNAKLLGKLDTQQLITYLLFCVHFVNISISVIQGVHLALGSF